MIIWRSGIIKVNIYPNKRHRRSEISGNNTVFKGVITKTINRNKSKILELTERNGCGKNA